MSGTGEITRLLQVWSDGDEQALQKLTPLLYRELHRMAHRYMRQERPGHTLQTTALINEAYLRLIGWKNSGGKTARISSDCRLTHFFGLSAQLMRKILVDFARSKNYAKRGAGACVISLDRDAVAAAQGRARDILALDEALRRLASFDLRKSKSSNWGSSVD
jgi:RNA polymerase sigma factor (TIGR02999 family)